MPVDSGQNQQHNKSQVDYELGVAGLVGKAINLWRRKLPKYMVIIGIAGVALTILQAMVLFFLFGAAGLELLEFVGTSTLDSVFSLILYPIFPEYLIIIFALTIFGLIIYAIIAGAAIHYTLTDYENRGSGTIGESFSYSAKLAIPLIGVQLIESLIVVSLAAISVVLMFIDALISLVMIIPTLYIAVRLAPALAIVISEERYPIQALRRSWQITARSFWHVFVGQLLMIIVVMIIDIGVAVGIAFILPSIIPELGFSILAVTLIFSGVFSSMNYIFLAVLYKDLEARENINRQ